MFFPAQPLGDLRILPYLQPIFGVPMKKADVV
jgi:hypothetical protein